MPCRKFEDRICSKYQILTHEWTCQAKVTAAAMWLWRDEKGSRGKSKQSNKLTSSGQLNDWKTQWLRRSVRQWNETQGSLKHMCMCMCL